MEFRFTEEQEAFREEVRDWLQENTPARWAEMDLGTWEENDESWDIQLEFEKKIQLKQKPLSMLGTFFIGMAFGAGWSPCTGPQLGSILAIAMGKETIWQGVLLLSIYSSGLALPFIFISIFINYLLAFVKKTSRFLPVFCWSFSGV